MIPRVHSRQARATVAAMLLLAAAGETPAATPALFARLAADRENIYRDESFRLTLSIFSTGDTLARQVSLSGMPDAAQISLSTFDELANESAVIDGRVYDVRRYRSRCRPHTVGPIHLAPQLQGTLVRTTRNYFLTQTQEQPVSIPVDPLTLEIADLPQEGRPPSFSGAVGTFTFTAKAEPLEVAVGDLVTVTTTITGEGLPDQFLAPSIPPAPGLKVYEIKPVAVQSDTDHRVFQQVVVAAEPYAKAIPALSFITFNPRVRRYQVLSAGPFPLVFHAERVPAAAPVYHPAATTSASPAVATAAIARGPGLLLRGWQAITGQHFGVIQSGSVAVVRFAPGADTRPLFKLEPGTRVRIESEAQGWVRISCPDGVGWVPSLAIQ